MNDFRVELSVERRRVPVAALWFIAAGAAGSLFQQGSAFQHTVWLAGLAITGVPLLWTTARGAARGRFAADLTASLTVIASLLLGQPLVGLVIVLMQSGGESLERLAAGRAASALQALEEGSPRTLHVVRSGVITDVDADAVQAGETILVRPGEMLGCDGVVLEGESHIDASSITGEALPERVTTGGVVMSGAMNQEGSLVIHVSKVARESQYARIVELVREAKSSKAPLQRIADRYAVIFTPFALAVCAVAYMVSRDWNRVLAVLAVATPCPLILATPVAMLGGLSRAARRQVLMRTGGALEALSRTTAIVFDKTGTITVGHPEVRRVIAVDSMSENEILRLSSGVEQGSGHPLARSLTVEAARRGQLSPPASRVVDSPGQGVEGEVEGRSVSVGARSFVTSRHPRTRAAVDRMDYTDMSRPELRAYVAVDGELAGLIEYADRIRPGMQDLVRQLRDDGIGHVMILSGDDTDNTAQVAKAVGIDEWRGDLLPQDKVEVVKRLTHDGESVVMVGDGTNDAPALSTATVGIALASRGRGIATEAADIILLADDPSRLGDALQISRRTMRIARQSIFFGLGISATGMLLAAAGAITPIAGAAMQEVVDLAVIINALRAARGPLYGKRREISSIARQTVVMMRDTFAEKDRIHA